ncbi:MAG: type II secretion system F family protein [Candidatus Aenigmarchaeota archaeon]|nr:type II secretion system F family protein [Candidatus Aenigmarchaeota archaeon]
MDAKSITIVSILLAALMLYFNITYLQSYSILFTTLNIVIVMIGLGIPVAYHYETYSRLKKIEQLFPIFLRDVTANIKNGMTLPQAIRSVKYNDYDVLTLHVKEISSKLDWGISFQNTLNVFAQKTKSRVIGRTVNTIIEAHESGGSIDTVLEAVASSIQEMEKIKQKRSIRIYSQMLNGYLIYIVFLGVMYGLANFLIPAFQIGQDTGNQAMFNEMFRNLTIIQGIFAGIAIGKMAEGRLVAGIKHSLVLTVIGYSLFLFTPNSPIMLF